MYLVSFPVKDSHGNRYNFKLYLEGELTVTNLETFFNNIRVTESNDPFYQMKELLRVHKTGFKKLESPAFFEYINVSEGMICSMPITPYRL
jgi:hypothetical protein